MKDVTDDYRRGYGDNKNGEMYKGDTPEYEKGWMEYELESVIEEYETRNAKAKRD